MKLNKKLELGINAINALKKFDKPAKISDIASEVNVTTINFLEQVMRDLRIAGLVTVKRGPGGGYTLDKNAKVTAYAVATAIGRDLSASSEETPLARLSRAVTEAYQNTTI